MPDLPTLSSVVVGDRVILKRRYAEERVVMVAKVTPLSITITEGHRPDLWDVFFRENGRPVMHSAARISVPSAKYLAQIKAKEQLDAAYWRVRKHIESGALWNLSLEQLQIIEDVLEQNAPSARGGTL